MGFRNCYVQPNHLEAQLKNHNINLAYNYCFIENKLFDGFDGKDVGENKMDNEADKENAKAEWWWVRRFHQ